MEEEAAAAAACLSVCHRQEREMEKGEGELMVESTSLFPLFLPPAKSSSLAKLVVGRRGGEGRWWKDRNLLPLPLLLPHNRTEKRGETVLFLPLFQDNFLFFFMSRAC